MGNSTVTPAAPATSGAPTILITPPIPRRSVSVFDPDSPTESPTPNTFSHSRTAEVPDASTNVHVSDIRTVSVTSSTFAFPVVSPTLAIPVVSPTTTPIVSSTPVVPVVTPHPTIPIISPNHPIPVVSPTAEIPIESTTPMVPVVSSTPETSIVSRNRAAPVVSWTPEFPIVASTAAVPEVSSIPEVPVISSSPEIPISSPTSNINGIPVISPDTSAVSPTIYPPDTPRASPTPTAAVVPVKSIIPVPQIRSTAPITYNVSTSPRFPFVPKNPVISTISRPNKAPPKQTLSKGPVPPSTSTFKQAKPSYLPYTERWDRWNKVEQKQQEKPKRLSYTTQPAPISNKPTTASKSTNTDAELTPVIPDVVAVPSFSLRSTATTASKSTNTDAELTPVIPDVVAVPSFSLRSTAISNPLQESHILSERTQSIHTDFSIIKYYLPFKERTQLVGDHRKATMSKMDTRLKKTPLPTPSFLFLNKNFSDGSDETYDNSPITPSFDSLGLQNDLETEPMDQSSTELRLHEKQQQRKLHQSALFSYENSDSNDPYQFVSSSIMSQPNFSTIEQPSVQHTRQPVTSILKKHSPQIITNPYPTEINSNIVQEFQKNDFETPYTISFNLPVTPSKKASQSITRSFKLFNRKK